ncbi:hypothetical protein ACSBR2_040653 [Camellia fascicularis]
MLPQQKKYNLLVQQSYQNLKIWAFFSPFHIAEYGMGEEVSTQGDMYSYGVLLLEMFTGKGPTSNMFTSNVNLHSYVKMCLPEQVMQIVDPQIILEMEEEPSKSMQSSTTNISKLEACLVPVFQIGV